MKRSISLVVINVLCSVMLLLAPLAAAAEPTSPAEPEEAAEALPAVIITQVQTGNAARADEFIQLYNTTDEPVDLTGWQLRYVTASAISAKIVADPSAIIKLAPPIVEGETLLLPAGGYYVLYSGLVVPPGDALSQPYEGLLPATGGSLVLVSPDDDTCELVVEDALAWGSTTHLFGEGEALPPGSSSSSDRLFRRYMSPEGAYVDANDNAGDFAAGAAGTLTPTTEDSPQLPDAPFPGSGVLSQVYDTRFANPDCVPPAEPEGPTDPPVTPPGESPPAIIEPPVSESEDTRPQPSIPAANIGLKSPVLSELLPNPAAPQTDRDDEFIELYNPNDAYFDLSGYILEVGTKTKKRHTIPAGIRIAPQSFLAFFSADTRLALSNSGSQVALLDPLGRALAVSEAYGTAKDGQAWVFASGIWQWTTKPTPNAINVVSVPVVKSKSTKKNAAATTASAKKSGSGSQSSAGSESDLEQVAAVAASTSTPLHPGVLALIAVSAVLYGAYEYRRDVANRIYQFRTNRVARRALRQSVKGG